MSGLPPHLVRRNRGFGFEGAEHTAIVDGTLLLFSEDAPGRPAAAHQLRLPNGLELTYGQVIALGGDFYGIPGKPISDGNSLPERVQRFQDAFDSLAKLDASREEAVKILEVMQREINAVNQAIEGGRQPHEAYDALGDTLSKEWNCITGGGCAVNAWFPMGRYLQLGVDNTDHFGECALAAYVAGHTAALQQAKVAHDTGIDKVQALEMAYAMNGFADHFLTDLFSAGHLRVPRKELADGVASPMYGPGAVGSLISRFMHDEDSEFGLNVCNAKGAHWCAHGDGRLFDAIDAENLRQVRLAVQASAGEIFRTFCSGEMPPEKEFEAPQYTPKLDAEKANFSPLFKKMEGGKVLRRKDVNNLNDENYIDNWWGLTTLTMLESRKFTRKI